MKYRDASLSIKERTDDLLARMTIDEKVAQLVQVYVTTENRAQIIERIRQTGLGSRILEGSNIACDAADNWEDVEELNNLQRMAVEESRLGIPLLHGHDVIHGYRTIFPIPLAMAATFNPDIVEQAYVIASAEASSAGIHWCFVPMLDIGRDPRWGRIIEGFGEDPYLGSSMAVAVVRGLQGHKNEQGYLPAQHVLACAKHYIGYGAAEGGRDYNTAEISDNTLRNIYLPPFKAAVEAGVGSVMSAFEDLNGDSASGSHYLLTVLLRGELGFEGLVITDWGAVADLVRHRLVENEQVAAKLALMAGVDMEMVSDCYYPHLAELVNRGDIPLERLDDAVRRVLIAKFCQGLFEHPYADVDHYAQAQFTPENKAIAYRVACQSMVLLKNTGILPLKKAAQRMAVIGPYADQRRALLGSWMLNGCAGETMTLVEAIQAACPQAKLLTAPTGLYDEMMMRAAEADVILLAVGESNSRNGEYSCVASLDLPAGQEELVNAVAELGKPLVVIVFAGRPVTLTHILPRVGALLYAWHPGTMGAAATASLLFGDETPGGKLPVTFPRTEGQIPIHYNHKSTGKRNPRYLDMPVEPLFPFGYGLSYTQFEYSQLRIQPTVGTPDETVMVSAVVSNTGSQAGEEVAQCYVQDCVSSLTRPERELKGFTRILLLPGESKTVEFKLGAAELSYYGPGAKQVLEPGEFKVWVGGDSTACLEASFRVQGK